MKLETRSVCPNCKNEKISLFKKGTINPSDLSEDDFKITDSHYGSLWTFYLCKKCHFVFSNPFIPEPDITEFYTHLIDQEYSSEAEGRAKNFAAILKNLAKLNKPGNRLLDIGAASGIFLNLARKAGYKIYGVEPSAYLVKQAKSNYNIDIIKGTIEQIDPENKFSVITLLDILEHLPDPNQVFKKITPLIEKNGILIVVTPDISSLAARLSGKYWWHFRTAHLNFFTYKSLNYLLQAHGFSILLKKRYAWNFTAFYLLTRIFPGVKKIRSLQKILKSINLRLNLFDSWEIYAKKN